MAGAPKRLDHFEIRDPLGAGGMGVVYRAYDRELSREVAIKVLPPELTDSGERRERFLREARAAARLTHANVVVIHAVGESQGTAYIAMELVEGRTVADAVAADGALDVSEARRVALGVARALVAAHEKSIVHRGRRRARTTPPPRRHRNADTVPADLAALIGDCLAKDPDEVLGTVLGEIRSLQLAREQERGTRKGG